MAATEDSGLGHGTNGSPQGSVEEQIYSDKATEIQTSLKQVKPAYVPITKHEPGHNWGSENPIKSKKEGQKLLDTGYKVGKQIYNMVVSSKL